MWSCSELRHRITTTAFFEFEPVLNSQRAARLTTGRFCLQRVRNSTEWLVDLAQCDFAGAAAKCAMRTRPEDDRLCPKCSRPMTLARITPKVGGIPALRTFRCGPCGHVVTEEVPIAARYHRPPAKT
jgi:hypothetical protein